MVTEMAAATTRRRSTFWSAVRDEWRGDGVLMKQGAWSEIVACLFATGPIGVVWLVWPEDSVRSDTFNLASWYYPPWAMATFLLLSAVLTATGIGLFFYRGRCVASRTCRLLGGMSGGMAWFFLFLLDGSAFGFRDATVYLYLLPFMLYLRTASLAWRRWFR